MPERARQYRKPPTTAPRAPTPAPRRGTRHERGYNSLWSRFARAYLREHPLCVKCKEAGRIQAAFCVDHIDGKGPLGERGYDLTNLQALCERCHNRKTAQDQHHNRKASDQ